ncbi:hypothetical protein JTB14_034320 [Gonioctena quinquepunctata]|nr:hypothetical protein JTB14_034320 [Gonioctena quinquepunctata]
MKVILFMAIIGTLNALHCDKQFNFGDKYGLRGFDIICQDLTQQYVYLLQNITINNEISLTIQNSKFESVTSEIFLKELEKGSLKYLVNLKDLQLTENHLKDTANLPMCDLKNLKSLNLSYNLMGTLDGSFVSCETSSKSMDFSENNQPVALKVAKNDYFAADDFASDLKDFDLSNNRIEALGNYLSHFKFIRVLKLQGNQLSQLESHNFKYLSDLEELILHDNNITLIEDGVFQGKDNLVHVDLSFNALAFFRIDNLPMLRYLDLGSNELEVDSLEGIKSSDSLQKLLLDDNDIAEIKPHSFQRFTKLEMLNLRNNRIVLNNFSFSGLAELESLYLSGNKIQELPEFVFSDLKKLRTLDLSNNKLKVITHSGTFKELKNLNILNISHNYLESLDYVLLQPMRSLHVLDVADNQLHYIQYDLIISNLPAISNLNIKENQLSCELLVKIVGYLKTKEINYTMQERNNIAQENVAGIFCKSEQNTEMIGFKSDSAEGKISPLFNVSMALVSILLIILIGMSCFKVYVYLKRRKYRADEFELIVE